MNEILDNLNKQVGNYVNDAAITSWTDLKFYGESYTSWYPIFYKSSILFQQFGVTQPVLFILITEFYSDADIS